MAHGIFVASEWPWLAIAGGVAALAASLWVARATGSALRRLAATVAPDGGRRLPPALVVRLARWVAWWLILMGAGVPATAIFLAVAAGHPEAWAGAGVLSVLCGIGILVAGRRRLAAELGRTAHRE